MRKARSVFPALLLGLGLILPGCGRTPPPKEPAQVYQVRGIVRGISPDERTIEIQHETIPDYMPSMTMPFSTREKIPGLQIGDAIAFRMTVTEKDFWIDQVQKIARAEVGLPDPKPVVRSESATPRLHEGDVMPLFSLSDQNGKMVTLESFAGRPFVLTFIFTRCPIPNFCPRMSNNFAALQSAIQDQSNGITKTRLLDVTLDPAFDSSEILKQYGEHFHADPQIWRLATGAPREIDSLTQAFSVYVQPEGGTISHGLATALIGPDGRIVKIWRGNGWTPAEVIAEIRAQKF